ncbi:MAG: hypothetical protein GXY34_10840 [Syntrophomonadaceae bacterium]|nr:hypothetical protein [Syntrophomonadaceae bacterium]
MILSEQELIAQLDREKVLFGEILALSERHLLLLGDADVTDDKLVEAFQDLIDERKKLMDLIDVIQVAIKETVEDSNFRDLVNRYQQEKKAIITSIQASDQKMFYLAQKTTSLIGNKLQETRSNIKATKAYYGEVDTGGKGWFIDRKK